MTALDARMAALAVQAFAVGLLPLVLVKVVAPAYFAREDTATPFRIAVIAVATNVVVNLATFRWFGHVGLAFATTASAWVNAGLLLRGVLRRGDYQPGPLVLRTGLRTLAATAGMVALLTVLLPAGEQWLHMRGIARVAWIAGGVAAGVATFVIALLATGERPRDLLHRV
jgi:putative peptidoglycan lipid II flippase